MVHKLATRLESAATISETELNRDALERQSDAFRNYFDYAETNFILEREVVTQPDGLLGHVPLMSLEQPLYFYNGNIWQAKSPRDLEPLELFKRRSLSDKLMHFVAETCPKQHQKGRAPIKTYEGVFPLYFNMRSAPSIADKYVDNDGHWGIKEAVEASTLEDAIQKRLQRWCQSFAPYNVHIDSLFIYSPEGWHMVDIDWAGFGQHNFTEHRVHTAQDRLPSQLF